MSLTLSELELLRGRFSQELLQEIAVHGMLAEIPAAMEILKEGQYIKTIPIVLKGLVKVFASFEEKELLLYYIEPSQSCVMTFSAALNNTPSRIFAITEEESTLLLLPVEKMNNWVRYYPQLNDLFYQQYNLRYSELLDTINSLLFNRMDQRLYNYLLEKSKLKAERILSLRHKQIAAELGTAREVISRVIKRLEQEGKVRQLPDGIEILETGD